MEPPRPPFEIAQAAVLLLAVVVIGGMLVVLAIVARCVFFFVEACNRDFGLREIFAELLVVLMALISRPRDKG